MDLVADMLLQTLRTEHSTEVTPVELRPRMRRRFAGSPLLSGSRHARTADRLVGRFVDYPLWLRSHARDAGVFHLVDHSYAHLVHALPAARTVVTCHDLDTFRSVLEPAVERRSAAFRAMTKRILSGLQAAAHIACDSNATRDAILAHGLVPAEKLSLNPLGVDPAMSAAPDPASDEFVAKLLGPVGRSVDLLHVGSTIPRKRIDVLLEVFAAVRRELPDTRLIRVGGRFTEAQSELTGKLGLHPASIVVMPYLTRHQLAAVYRRAALVLLPSDAEGFGFPVVEAMACGTPVVASDLPVLREVGGAAAVYCPVADERSWTGTVCAMLRQRRDRPDDWSARRQAALTQANMFTWGRYAASMVDIYRTLGAVTSRSPADRR
jgi:glycosyltransferase involved in cell wall biosynthesis